MHVLERCLSVRHLDGRDAQSPHISPVAVSVFPTRHNFRRHPTRRSDTRVAFIERPIQLARQPEITQLHLSVLRDQNVAASHVSMDHFVLVQVYEGLEMNA